MARAIPFFPGRGGAWCEWSPCTKHWFRSGACGYRRSAKDMLPALCNLRFNGTRGYMSEIIESFVAARQPSNRRPGFAHRIRGEGWLDYRSEDG
jgi:hypothetical protein